MDQLRDGYQPFSLELPQDNPSAAGPAIERGSGGHKITIFGPESAALANRSLKLRSLARKQGLVALQVLEVPGGDPAAAKQLLDQQGAPAGQFFLVPRFEELTEGTADIVLKIHFRGHSCFTVVQGSKILAFPGGQGTKKADRYPIGLFIHP
jgi:hypothetical protein